MPDRRRTQSGQVAPLLVVVLLVAGLACAGVVKVGLVAAHRAEAQAAADAAALAGAATSDRGAAASVATANGARLITYAQEDEVVAVEVQVDGIIARARARWLPAPIP